MGLILAGVVRTEELFKCTSEIKSERMNENDKMLACNLSQSVGSKFKIISGDRST